MSSTSQIHLLALVGLCHKYQTSDHQDFESVGILTCVTKDEPRIYNVREGGCTDTLLLADYVSDIISSPTGSASSRLQSTHVIAESTQSSVDTCERRFLCDFCNKSFSRLSRLRHHLRTIHSSELHFVCDKCGKRFTHSVHLQSHRLTHASEGPFICETCNKPFKSSLRLRGHQLVHTGEQQFICHTCNRQFSQASSLLRHQSVHTGEQSYKCTTCNKQFSDSSNLRRHQLVHTGEKRFVCETCNQRFAYLQHLRNHQLIHTGDRRFFCQTCDKRFSQLSCLHLHELRHSNERRFVCETCDRRFTDFSNLCRHQLVHTRDRKFICGTCNKGFNIISRFHTHCAIHANDAELFRCEACKERFTSHSLLCLHESTCHSNTLQDSHPATVEHELRGNLSDRRVKPTQSYMEELNQTEQLATNFYCGICTKNYQAEDEVKACYYGHLFEDNYLPLSESMSGFDHCDVPMCGEMSDLAYVSELNQAGRLIHRFYCGICAEMYQTEDEVKTCFYTHLVEDDPLSTYDAISGCGD